LLGITPRSQAALSDPALLNSYGALLCNWDDRYGEARASFQQALAVDPTFNAAQDGLRWVEARLP
jgi:Tfp pilus assembly protein PilF